MKQYCRYCAHAVNIEGGDTNVWCEELHKEFPANCAKTVNRCKCYEHNGLDIFSNNPDGSFREYKPRDSVVKKAKEEYAEQLDFDYMAHTDLR